MPVNAHLEEGERLYGRGEFAAAHARLEDAAIEESSEPRVHWLKGHVLRGEQRHQDALESYRMALQLDANCAEAHLGIAQSLTALHQFAEAIAAGHRAVAADANSAEAEYALATALDIAGQKEEAVCHYRAAAQLSPQSRRLQYIAAAVDPHIPTPPAAPSDYVRVLFAEYAPNFDTHLRDVLKCRVPQQLLKAVRAAGMGKNLDVLDLGCGTGLVGSAFREGGRAKILVGVDLCPEMLKQAAARRIYTQLIEGENDAYLAGTNLRFDLVTAGDVFIYVGDLAKTFALTASILRPGGLFAFSVEAQDEDGYQLRPSRRYTHGIDYIKRVARENRFSEVSIGRQTLRRENDQDVSGWIVVLRRLPK